MITHGAILNKGRLTYTFSREGLKAESLSMLSIFYKNEITKLKDFLNNLKVEYISKNGVLHLYGITEERKWAIVEACNEESGAILKIKSQISLEELFISKIQENDLQLHN